MTRFFSLCSRGRLVVLAGLLSGSVFLAGDAQSQPVNAPTVVNLVAGLHNVPGQVADFREIADHQSPSFVLVSTDRLVGTDNAAAYRSALERRQRDVIYLRSVLGGYESVVASLNREAVRLADVVAIDVLPDRTAIIFYEPQADNWTARMR